MSLFSLEGIMDHFFKFLSFVTLAQQVRLELKFEIANTQLKMYKDRHGTIFDSTYEEKIKLAELGKKLGEKELHNIHNTVKPSTIMRWYRDFIKNAKKPSKRGRGRPGAMKAIVELVLALCFANPNYGDGRIAGQINNRGHKVKKSTVRKIRKKHGIEASPDRMKHSPWNNFIQSQLACLFATDTFVVDIIDAMSGFKVRTYYVLFFIHLATRKVHIAGITEHPNKFWMRRMAINATDPIDGFLKDAKYLIHDRDTNFMKSGFRDILLKSGVKPVATARRAPDMNAYAERFVQSIKNECTRKLMFFREESLRFALKQYELHHNHERNHQGIDNKLIDPQVTLAEYGVPKLKKRIGGLLKFYYTEAA